MEVKIRRDEDGPESEAEGGTGEKTSQVRTDYMGVHGFSWNTSFNTEWILLHKQIQMS